MKKISAEEKDIKINEDEILIFREHKIPNAHLLTQTAKACYVMARPILITNNLWYIPASIFVMHHSMECFIKAFLIKENIKYEMGQKGHNLIYLLELGYKNNKLVFFREVLKDENTKEILNSLKNYYNKNKYWETGFNIKIVSLIDIFDKFISIFTEKFHQLYGNSKREASIDVPEELADLIELDLKYPITLCILPKW